MGAKVKFDPSSQVVLMATCFSYCTRVKNNFFYLFSILIVNTWIETLVFLELASEIRAHYIRFRPNVWHGYISMKVELYGCKGTVGFFT